MRLHLVAVGRMASGPERELVDDYVRRARSLARSVGIRSVTEVEVPSGGGAAAEGARLIGRVPAEARAIRLDRRGEDIDSAALAARLAAWRDAATGDAAFLIGGADGFSAELTAAFPGAVAFGRQTWPHRLVRVMLAEQLYRALTILAGTPYHKV